MNELTEEELLYASPEDRAFYIDKILPGLPTREGREGDYLDKYGVEIPFHSGPHILRHLRETIEIVKPLYILEIGFNMGHSSAMWLNLCDAGVVSMDISEKDETIEAAEYLTRIYDNRFMYINREEVHVLAARFDLCFIDGAHDEESITKDIQFCKKLKIPYLLFDDWYPRYGETQKAVAKFPELELVKDMNNLRLYKVNYGN